MFPAKVAVLNPELFPCEIAAFTEVLEAFIHWFVSTCQVKYEVHLRSASCKRAECV